MTATLTEVQQSDLAALQAEILAFNQQSQQRDERPAPKREEGTDWRLVIDTSNDAFVCVDASGVIHEWNLRAEEMFGWSREEALGRQLKDTIFPPGVSNADDSGLKQLTRAGEDGRRLEVTARRRDGSEAPVEVSMSMMQRGGTIAFNAFIHDISSRRSLQTQLAHAQKLESIGQLAAGISHEINTPTQYVGDNTRFIREAMADVATVLKAYADLASAVKSGQDAAASLAHVEEAITDTELDYLIEETNDAVTQSLEGIGRVASIVRAMKEFSHPGAATKTPTNLNAAIDATVTVATNEWKYVATVEKDYDENLPLTPCLPGEFNQVILNIIVNAAHAIGEKIGDTHGEKGVITIRTRRLENEAELSIQDTGVGIPEEVINRVFDPFFTTKEVGLGTGQGLAISRSVIVDKLGGTISVDSTPGVGSVFTIRLPAPSEGSAPTEQSGGAAV